MTIVGLDIAREKDLISFGFGARVTDCEGNDTKLNVIMYECDVRRWLVESFASDISLRLVVK